MSDLPERDLRVRTKQFAPRTIKLVDSLPRSAVGRVIGSQLLRSATSVGANYREALRSRTAVEYASKLGICLQELEESLYWFELIAESGLLSSARIKALMVECDELAAIFVALSKAAGSRPRIARDLHSS